MLVETWMSKPVITVGANDPMQKATALLKENHISILPVMEDGKLVVMGTHGYKGLERAIFGNVARKVVKNSSVPVLTINPYKLK